jgi:hypothetical protein
MAKAHRVVEHHLTLTVREMEYMKALLQNYLGDGEESEQDMNIRKSLWNALSASGSTLDNGWEEEF